MINLDRYQDPFEIESIEFGNVASYRQYIENNSKNPADLQFSITWKGQVTLQVASKREFVLNVGDLVLSTPSDKKAVAGNSNANLIFGSIIYKDEHLFESLKNLPDPFVLSPALKASNPIIDDVLNLIVLHVSNESKRTVAILSRLFEILFVEITASIGKKDPSEDQIKQAIEDQKIALAISMIHGDLDRDWSDGDLALEVDMPLTRFSKRFEETVKSGATSYLFRWRLQRSLGFLDRSDMSLADITTLSGFDSESDYNAAFTDLYGLTPNQYRQKSLH
jgi:AraC-like DNA-binding protein